METVRRPSSVAARKIRMAISERLAAMSFLNGRILSTGVFPAELEVSSPRGDSLINRGAYRGEGTGWQSNDSIRPRRREVGLETGKAVAWNRGLESPPNPQTGMFALQQEPGLSSLRVQSTFQSPVSHPL